MKAFVIAETEAGARELCAGARTMADEVVLCTIGTSVAGVADKCLHIEVPASSVADDAYVTVDRAFDAEGAGVVLAEQTVRSLSLCGRLAAHLGTSAITGVSGFTDGAVSSMYFGGAGVRAARAEGPVAVYTVAPGTFDGATATGTDAVEELPFEAPANTIAKTGEESLPKSGVDLAAADAVVACGRGFSAEEDLQLARGLAARIGAEVGCTRPLAEGVAWFSREAYIGVSGQTVSPKVYIAVGISGQMQHMVGCGKSDTIFAVNKDENAPIFKQCDYGLVGDLRTVLPALTAAL